MSKYKNTKTVFNGITFDSKREAERYKILWMLERAGKIKNLRLQVPFELIPSQKLPKPYRKRGSRKMTRTLQSAVYVADFVYEQNGEIIVEDVKGFRTPLYDLKKKMMLYIHGIQVMEV